MENLKFDLEDDLSITDLRRIDEWEPRLASAGKLRVQRRGEVVGVLLSAQAWREFKDRTERNERALRAIENHRDNSIIAQRDGGKLLGGEKLREALERELKEAGLL